MLGTIYRTIAWLTINCGKVIGTNPEANTQ